MLLRIEMNTLDFGYSRGVLRLVFFFFIFEKEKEEAEKELSGRRCSPAVIGK